MRWHSTTRALNSLIISGHLLHVLAGCLCVASLVRTSLLRKHRPPACSRGSPTQNRRVERLLKRQETEGVLTVGFFDKGKHLSLLSAIHSGRGKQSAAIRNHSTQLQFQRRLWPVLEGYAGRALQKAPAGAKRGPPSKEGKATQQSKIAP